MAKLTMYQVAVLWHPDFTKEEEKEMDSIILKEPHFIMSKDEKTIIYKIVRELDEKFIETMNQIEILIRPF